VLTDFNFVKRRPFYMLAALLATSPKRVFAIGSRLWRNCPECSSMPRATDFHGGRIDERINHLLKHGYKLLYVGQETTTDPDGKPWRTTVAILGK